MLQFIFGRAASGKTTAVFSRLLNIAAHGGEAVIIVPEQFSFDTERDVLKALGDANASRISVMSFTRLCSEVERQTGGGCGTLLTDAHKLILLNRALKIAEPELKAWKRFISFPGFISALLESIEEFKQSAVTPEQLLIAADAAESSALSAKLYDTATVMLHYNALISERFTDPSDSLTVLAQKLLDYRFFEGKTVFLDSFKGFTGQQYRIIDRIISQASDVTVCLPLDKLEENGAEVFSNIRKTAERIKRIAASHGVKAEETYLSGEYFIGRSIASAEQILSGGKLCENDGSVVICRADTVYDEAEFAARNIRRLIRENSDYRFRDFVMIARDTDIYEEAVAAACERNGVSCFYDKRMPLGSFPPAAGLLAALEAVRRYDTEQILRFLKSGIGPLSLEKVSELENYTALWGIEGSRWFDEWDMNPDGFVADEDAAAENGKPDDRLSRLNEMRVLATEPLRRLEKKLCGGAVDFCAAIYDMFSSCRAAESMRKLYYSLKEEGKLSEADALRQSWDELASLLDSFAECYGGYEPEPAEFRETLKKAIGLASIGTAPQMLDQVTFGAADRIRPARPRVAFILGANSGVFPKNTTPSGLFGNSERKSLISMNIDIPDRGVFSAIDEDFLVYTNFCCATEKVYLSYSCVNSAGEQTEPSAFVDSLSEKLKIMPKAEPAPLSPENMPETPSDAFSEGCKRYPSEQSEGATLFSALDGIPDFKQRLKSVMTSSERNSERLSEGTAFKLYGNTINMSASRLDTFYRCGFRHFCRYGLRINSPQKAEINAGQRGLMVHYVLQQLVTSHGKSLSELPDDRLITEVNGYIAEYLSKIPGYRSAETPYLRFLSENVARSTRDVALRLKKEFAQCEFEPKACEFRFGASDGNAVIIPFKGGELRLNGMIDRVDTYSGYLRIVDYKTGSRSFRLSDIIVGQNMQMLMYLYAVLHDKRFAENVPAGILYMPAKREKGDEKKLKMNGLLAADEKIVCAMEENNAGEFVPMLKFKADGELDRHSASSYIPENSFDKIFSYLEKKLRQAGENILAGDISVDPVNGSGNGGEACAYCEFAAACRIEDEPAKQAASYTNAQVLDIISNGNGDENNGV